MFTTFSTNGNAGYSQHVNDHTAAPMRPKRIQDTRACDWCRLSRIKCDDLQPCTNCRSRGGRCSNFDSLPAASLPAANREIERLRQRVRELEERSKTETENRQPQNSVFTTSGKLDEAARVELLNSKRPWEEVRQRTILEGSTSNWGPPSTTYFNTRMCRYIEETLGHSFPESLLEPNATSSNLSSLPYPPQSRESDVTSVQYSRTSTEGVEGYSQSQESNFLNLLWQSFHCIHPILAESAFWEHYYSLWLNSSANGRTKRRPSALVDILLAICMQYGATFLDSSEQNQETGRVFGSNDASVAGHWYYSRCQELLSDEIENPSVRTLQSYIFSVIYLCNASCLNSAHITLTVAIRIAHVLGLHMEPSKDLSVGTQHLQRRIWWTLLSLDSEISVCTGQPPLIRLSDVSCDLPTDSLEQELMSTTKLLSHDDEVSWLTFHVQTIKLTCAVRSVHTAFQDKCSEVINANNLNDIYADPQSTEVLAIFLRHEIQVVHDWAQHLPPCFMHSSRGAVAPFSVGQVKRTIDPHRPLWLQRQIILLELLYHNFAMCLYRPFIRFPPHFSSITPLSDSHNITCLNHAIATTFIVHQVLSETDILTGWRQVFQFQWNAVIIMLGFIIANPLGPVSPSARKAIEPAMKTLELLSRNFASASTGIAIIQKISDIAEVLASRCRESLLNWRSPRSSLPSPQSIPTTMPSPRDSSQMVSAASNDLQIIDSNQMGRPQSSGLGTPFEKLDMSSPLQPAGASTAAIESVSNHMNMVVNSNMFMSPDTAWMHNNSHPVDRWPQSAMYP
ncbi:hypothetical protein EV356DRAFT_536724 [Viridothelium virens]|uniref:Zn(2)-C6 fungal-type domain-containing protein n=1 Tax=Viridothelium virens TaxID=1048519 RepID=A0A6A6GX63_VIRVR|nr:hypothetical protein EV356DRAFT_536724 [Viridothelium virens]